jgi:hypothetical protein
LCSEEQRRKRVEYQNQSIILRVTPDSPSPVKFDKKTYKGTNSRIKFLVPLKKGLQRETEANIPMCMTRKLLDRNLGLPEIPDMYARFILCSYLHNRMFDPSQQSYDNIFKSKVELHNNSVQLNADVENDLNGYAQHIYLHTILFNRVLRSALELQERSLTSICSLLGL